MTNDWHLWLTDAGWVAAFLLGCVAVVVASVVLFRKLRQVRSARSAHAMLGVTSTEVTPCSLGQEDTASYISTMSRTEGTIRSLWSPTQSFLPGGTFSEGSSEAPCLALSPAVPHPVRLLQPVLATACCTLLLVADFSVVARVQATVLAAGAPSGGEWKWSGDMARLTLLSAASDSWTSGAKTSAVVLGLLNGIWPMLQVLLLLLAWLLPARILTVETRGRLLRSLAALSKWSLSFPWLLTLWATVNRLHWHRPAISSDFQMVLDYGLFEFLGAAVLANVMCYMGDYFHRCSKKPTGGIAGDASAAGCERRRSLRSFGRQSKWLGLLCPLVLIATLAGGLAPAFSVYCEGPKGQESQSVCNHSLLSFGMQVAEDSPELLGPRVLQATILVTTLLVPLLLTGGLCALWFAPLTAVSQNYLMQVCHALDSWVALDVFAVAVALASLDSQRLMQYAGSHGDMSEICRWLRSGSEERIAGLCGGGAVSLRSGFGLLAVAALACDVVPKVLLRACRQATRSRDEKLHRHRASAALAGLGTS